MAKTRNRLSGLLVLTIIAGLVGGPAAFAECKIIRGESHGVESVTLENDLIRLTILPASYGKIVEYRLKSTGENFFFDLNESRLPLLKDVVLTETNHAGYKEWIWEIGLTSLCAPYVWDIVKETAGECVVRLRYTGASYGIERTVSIREHSAEVALSITLFNPTDAPACLSLWAHLCGIQPGGPVPATEAADLRVFAPTGKNERKPKTKPDNSVLTSLTEDGVYAQPVQIGSTYLFPRQGWFGMAHARRKIAFAVWLPLEEINRDGLFYQCHWTDKKRQTQDAPTLGDTLEIVYNEVRLAPKEQVTRKLYWSGTSVMDGLSYAGRNLFLYLLSPEIEVAGRTACVRVQAASPRILKGHTLEIDIVDGQKKVLGKGVMALDEIGPDRAILGTVAIDLDRAAAPDFGARFRLLNEKQECVEEGDLLGVRFPATAKVAPVSEGM